MAQIDVIEEIDKALFAHGAWKMRLREAISKGSSDLTPEIARRDDCCAFGQWLHSAGVDPKLRASVSHQTATQLHKEFHVAAGKVLEEALRENRSGAISLLKGEFNDRSRTLMIALTGWKRELGKSKAA